MHCARLIVTLPRNANYTSVYDIDSCSINRIIHLIEYTIFLTDMEDYVLTVPLKDKSFMEALASRMGWQVRTRRSSVERFIKSCPKSPVMTDEEIAAEVNAVRYGA